MVLTGGRSRRMGFDKATATVGGRSLAVSVAEVLASVAAPVVEVGPGVAGTALVTREEPPGTGPLPAVAAGVAVLGACGHGGDVLVAACDLPLLGPGILQLLAGFAAPASVVPVVAGHPQPLCARWSGPDLVAAAAAVAAGERSMRPLLARPGVVLLDEAAWGAVARADELADADVPADLDRLAPGWSPPAPGRPNRAPPSPVPGRTIPPPAPPGTGTREDRPATEVR